MKKILLTSLSFILLTSCATKQVLTPLASTTKVSNTVQSQSVIDESKRKGVFSVQLQLIDCCFFKNKRF